MQTVRSYEDARESIEQWNRDLETVPKLADRLSNHQHFYYADDIDMVGPSKFAGYIGMTGETYVRLARAPIGGLWGGETERALQHHTVGFVELDPGTPEDKAVRQRVEEVLRRYGKLPRRSGVRMHARREWVRSFHSQRERTPEVRRSTPAAHTSPLQRSALVVIREGEDGYFVASGINVAVVTQGKTLDETVSNIREAVALYFEDEDLAILGFAPNPSIAITMELESAVA